MPAPGDTLLLSSAHQTDPQAQQRREQGLLVRAREGEIHLHISTLQGQLLSLGRFHSSPPDGGARVWHRRTGGRAVAAGDGFLVITLALPGRSTLGESLRPEQILNRGVRGVLHWLRAMRIDPVYPGLDFITAQQQRLAHLGFSEGVSGELLIQILLAQTTSLSETMLRLDRLDPTGVVPAMIWLPEESTTLARLGCTEGAHLTPGEALGALGAAYAKILGRGVGVCHASSLERWGQTKSVDYADTFLAKTGRAQVEGRLGPILSSLRVRNGRIASLGLEGDFLAPDHFPQTLARALQGKPATSETLRLSLVDIFESQGLYALGMDAALLEGLLQRALEAAS